MNCKATNQTTGEVRYYTFGLHSCYIETHETGCYVPDVRAESKAKAWEEYMKLEWPWIREGK